MSHTLKKHQDSILNWWLSVILHGRDPIHFEKKTRHLCGLWICGKKQKSMSLWYEFLCMAMWVPGDSPTKKVTCRIIFWRITILGLHGFDFIFIAFNLGGGFNYFLFSPLPGEMIHFIICFKWVETTNQYIICVYHHLGRCLLDLREKHMRWPAGSEEKRTHAIPRLYGRGFFLANFGNFGFDFLVYQSITYILTDSTHLFTNKRLIHVSVLIFPLISLCIPVSLFKPAETSLFRRFILCLFSSSARCWESSTLGWSVMIRRSNCPCNIRVFRNSL